MGGNLPDSVFKLCRVRVVLYEQIRSSGSLAFEISAMANFISSPSLAKVSSFPPLKTLVILLTLTENVFSAKVVEAYLLVAAVLYLNEELFEGVLLLELLFLFGGEA